MLLVACCRPIASAANISQGFMLHLSEVTCSAGILQWVWGSVGMGVSAGEARSSQGGAGGLQVSLGGLIVLVLAAGVAAGVGRSCVGSLGHASAVQFDDPERPARRHHRRAGLRARPGLWSQWLRYS